MDRCVDLDVLANALDLLRSRDHAAQPSLRELVLLLEGLGGLSAAPDASDTNGDGMTTPTRSRRKGARSGGVEDGEKSPASSISSTLPSPWTDDPIDQADVDHRADSDRYMNDAGHPTSSPNRFGTGTGRPDDSTTFFFKPPQKPAFVNNYMQQEGDKPEIIFGVQNINLSGGGGSEGPDASNNASFHVGSADGTAKAGRSSSGKHRRSPLKGKKRAAFATPMKSQDMKSQQAAATAGEDVDGGVGAGAPMEESPRVAATGIDTKSDTNATSSAPFGKASFFSSSTDFIDSSGGDSVTHDMASMNLGTSAESAPSTSFSFSGANATFNIGSNAPHAVNKNSSGAFFASSTPNNTSTPPPFGVFSFGNAAAANQNQAPVSNIDKSINDMSSAFSGFSFTGAGAASENSVPAVAFNLGVGDKDKASAKKSSSAGAKRKPIPRGRAAASGQATSGMKVDDDNEAVVNGTGGSGSVRSEHDSSSSSADHVENEKRMMEFAELMKNHGTTAYNDNDYESALDAFSKALSAAPPSWQNRLTVYAHKIAALTMLNRNVDAIEVSNEAINMYKSQLGTPFFQSLPHDVLASMSISIMKINIRKGRALLKIGQFASSHLSFTDVLDSARASTAYAQSMGPLFQLSPQFNQQMEQLRADEDSTRVDAKAGIKQVLLAKVIYNRLSLLQSQPDDTQFLSTSEELLKICPDFRSAQNMKARALCRQKEWSKAKTYIETCVCPRSIATQKLWAHPSCTIPVASITSLAWRHELPKNRVGDAKGVFNVNIADVANAALAMGGAMAKTYLTCLKNDKLARFLCAESMDAVLGVLSAMNNSIGEQTNIAPSGYGVFCVDTPVDESLTQWSWIRDELRRLKSMIEVKNIADDKFRASKFAEALTGYSSFIKMDPEAFTWNAVMYGNRAAALMRLELYSEAVADCSQAIDRDPLYYRAHLRRARAYKSLGEFASSVRDYRSYLSAPADDPSVSPSDRDAIKAEVDEVTKLAARAAAQQKQQQQQQQQQRQGYSNSGSGGGFRGFYQQQGRRVPPNPFQTGNLESDSDEEGEEDEDYGAYFSYSRNKGRSAPPPPQRPQTSQSTRQEHNFRSNSYASASGSSGRGDSRRPETAYASSSSGHHAGSQQQQRSPPHTGQSSRNSGQPHKPQPRSDVPPPNSHYATLGVTMCATDQEIKTAFRQLALKYHPDKNRQDGAEEKFKLVTEAYSVLMDKTQRRTYDFSLHY